MRVFTLLVTLLVLSCAVSGSVNPAVEVTGYSPQMAHVNGQDAITINGFGFRTYSNVICVWGGRWVSSTSRIASNTRIICDTPAIPHGELSLGLPMTTDFVLIFDGDQLDYEYTIFVDSDFVFGPSIDQFEPTNGFVSGGNVLEITGWGFSDFANATVMLDNKPCVSTTIVSDTIIDCVVPAGEFNQNAMVNVYFENNSQFYLHADETYHYGPIITSISPPCGNVNGGTVVTLTGSNLNDPIIGADVLPNGSPIVRVIVNNIQYTAPSASYTGNSIAFTTPTIPNSLGLDVIIEVFFKQVNSKVSVAAPFRYGPIVYNPGNYGGFPAVNNPSPQTGHAGGGDTITISGCGFSLFNRSQIAPMISVGSSSSELCIRGSGAGNFDDTLRIVPGQTIGQDLLVCFTNQVPCTTTGSLTRQVSVDFTTAQASVTEPSEGQITFTPGPFVNTTSMTPTRGTYTGLVSVNITGSNLFQNAFSSAGNPGWRVLVTFSTNYTSIGTVVSDTLINFETPSALWGLDADVEIDFITTSGNTTLCPNFPRTGSLSFFFGPQCNSVVPSNGWLSGNRPVQVFGNGFTESDAITNVWMCNDRLNGGSGCSVRDNITPFQVSGNSVNFTTTSIRQGITTVVGGNRLFGDTAQVVLVFDVPTDDLAPGADGSLNCGTYRFGPVVNGITPNKGPIGPRGDQSPGTLVTISGSAFNDPLYNTQLEFQFGSIAGFGASVFPNDASLSDTLAIGYTLWGGQVQSDVDVSVVFNTCNTTFSNFVLEWGPRISDTGLTIDQRSPLPANNPNLDLWGVLPFGGQTVTVRGHGFSEYYFDFGSFEIFDAYCLIGGVEVPVEYVDDNTVTCTTPDLPFDTNATLALVFSSFCGSYYYDYKQVLVAKQRLLYTPRLDSFSPVYGLTSGNQPVTIFGEGFVGWNDYYCFFGSYTNGISATAGGDGTSLTCNTPPHRGGFNTDVFVAVELYDPERTFEYDMRVISTQTYHYGPICTGANPINGPLIGGYVITILGEGFQDCQVSDTQPFRNCEFEFFNVSFRDRTTGERVYGIPVDNSTLASPNTATSLQVQVPNGTCLWDPIVEINFIDAVVLYSEQHFVECKNNADFVFRFGPIVTSIQTDHVRNNIAYGWIIDQVTINGAGFLDSSFSGVECQFNNSVAPIVSITDTQVICTAPNNTWNALVEVQLVFFVIPITDPINPDNPEQPIQPDQPVLTSESNCTLAAGFFHYGPVIDSLSPARGYVQGDVTLTVTGFAFDCCGIDQWSMMLPAGDCQGSTRNGDTVTCAAPAAPNVDYVLVNVGVRFNSTNFGINGINGTFTYQTLTESGIALKYFYGPIITGFTPSVTSLSGLYVPITIQGVGFADPFLSQPLCDFFSTTGGVNNIGMTPISSDDTSIVCLPAPYTHQCGAIDNISPRWTTALGGSFIYTTFTDPPPNLPRLPYFVSVASPTRRFFGPIRYGAQVVDVLPSVGPGPDSSPDGSISSWTIGGLELTIIADDLSDYVSEDAEQSFGAGLAQCVFGNRRSPVTSIGTTGNPNAVNCVVPFGAFDYSGTVALLLNPNSDSQTTLSTSGTDYWHWTPYATSYNRQWGKLTGFETVVVNGGGFCAYETVNCIFDETEAIQGDIHDDYSVICQSPPSAIGRDATVTLEFCSTGFANCMTLGSYDTTTVIDPFVYAGIQTFQPVSGPTCGGTEVTITGNGFQFFSAIYCQFAGKTTQATVISNYTLLCTTPSVDTKSVKDLVRCSSVNLLAVPQTGNGQVVIRSGLTFQFGVPQPLTITPNNSVITQSTQVTVTGEYFNANGDPKTYLCRWGNYPAVPAQKLIQLDNGQYQLICSTPSLSNTPNLTVGLVDFEVSFNCPVTSRFSVSRLKYLFTQNAFIDTFTPSEGPEIGGTNITVAGYFAGGSSYFCSFGKILVTATRIDDNTLWCVSPANKASTGTQVKFSVSIDGAATLIPADDPYIYQNVKCGAGSMSPAVILSLLVILMSLLFF